jgi:hypothetical protein
MADYRISGSIEKLYYSIRIMIQPLFAFAVLMCFTACSSRNDELFKNTDAFVQSLHSTYESYGVLEVEQYSKTTSDGMYSVTPIGRLINVKIQKASTDQDYYELKEDIKDYYENDNRVNDVYICQGGTVMIDCRN